MAGTVAWNANRFFARTQNRVMGRMDEVLEDLADLARQKAPVRKGSERAKRPIRVTITDFRKNPTNLSRATGSSLKRLARVHAIELEPHAIGLTSAERYAVRTGRVARVRRSPGGILRVVIGGHLRDSIHAVEADLEGKNVVGYVRAEAHYAAAMELGFNHKPGNRFVKGQPYLRPAMEEIRRTLASRIGGD